MKQFSNRQNLIFTIISSIGFFFCATLIFIIGYYQDQIQFFLSTNIFHRDFNLSKWANLSVLPMMILIFLDICLFFKYSDKSKVILIILINFIILILIGCSSILKSSDFMNSDMASELLLGKECMLQKNFVPRTWNYSTEIRLLNTQLITGPLFFITSNWNLIKFISIIIMLIGMEFSLLFLLNQLNIKKLWIKLLACTLLISPFSIDYWNFVIFGNYYIPHIIIAFIYTGLFYSLSYKEISSKKRTSYLILLLFLGIMSGLAGIRYILYFQFPLAQTFIFIEVCKSLNYENKFSFKSFFINNKIVFYSLLALILGVIGYLTNSIILPHLFKFSTYLDTVFTTIGDVTFTQVLTAFLKFFGYQNEVAVFTSAGIVNVLVYLSLVLFTIAIIKHIKYEKNTPQSIFIIYFLVINVFNSFIIINTEYQDRYFILGLIFIIPCLVILYSSHVISKMLKFLTISVFSFLLLSSTFVTFENILSYHDNKDQKDIAKFLTESNYDFGYATFWNANIYSFLTNDKIEIANISRDEEPNSNYINFDMWLTPDRFYDFSQDPNKHVFFIVTKEEMNSLFTPSLFEDGSLVYDNNNYLIYDFLNKDMILKKLKN